MRRNLLQKLYLFVHRRTFARRLARAKRFPGMRVISVGNLSAGGTGKTPAVARLARVALERGRRPLILLRGYRGRASAEGLLVSDGEGLLATARDAGDEAVLLAGLVPGARVAVGRDRVRALERFAGQSDLVLLDDAFQNPSVVRDFDLVLIDASIAPEEVRLLPTGRFREDFEALDRAHAVLLSRVDQSGPERLRDYEALIRRRKDLPIFAAAHRPGRLVPAFAGDSGGEEATFDPAHLGAFCGLGNPAAFERTLHDQGHAVQKFRAFPDHHPFGRADLEELFHGNSLHWITTAKDLVRLREQDRGALDGEYRRRLWVLPIEMEIQDDREEEFLGLVLGERA